MFKCMPDQFKGDLLSTAMEAIYEFINKKDNKDRGQGFVSLGRMSTLVEPRTFEKQLHTILTLLSKELVPPQKSEK